MWELPEVVVLSAGHAEGITPLNAFDNALLAAGVGNLNLIRVTSIIPPGARVVKLVESWPAQLKKYLRPGMLVPAVYEYIVSQKPGQLITAAIGAGLPVNVKQNGVIVEYKCVGETGEAEKMGRKMIENMFEQRKMKLKQVKIVSTKHQVKKIGCAVAIALLLKNAVK